MNKWPKKRCCISDQTRNSKALYTHCYRHALNLAVADVIRLIKFLKDTLDVTFEIVKIVLVIRCLGGRFGVNWPSTFLKMLKLPE